MGMLGYEEEERSVGEVAETLYSKVTHYHAQIGHSVKREALNELEWKLLSEAKDLMDAHFKLRCAAPPPHRPPRPQPHDT